MAVAKESVAAGRSKLLPPMSGGGGWADMLVGHSEKTFMLLCKMQLLGG